MILLPKILQQAYEFLWGVISEVPREVLVALAVTGLLALVKWVWDISHRRKFRRVFGKTKEYYLAFGSMEVHPQLLSLARTYGHQSFAAFPLAKSGHPNMAFNAQKVASGCEIRAVAYMDSSLSKEGGVALNVVTDDSIADRLDVDFIAFGALSNLKTLDIFKNPANRMAEYDPGTEFFVSREDRKPLYQRRDGYDYGIILKIHPSQFPARAWICCAGCGEWGTSGTAWFLANRWKVIAKKVKSADQFLCVIEVSPGQDESATLTCPPKTSPVIK